MTNPNDPAYPFPHINEMKGPILDQLAQSRGLTKREYFAAMAMQGMIAGSQGLVITTDQFASQSVKLADALIAELSKPSE